MFIFTRNSLTVRSSTRRIKGNIKQSPFLVGGDPRSLALAHAELFCKEMKKHSYSIRKKLTMY